MDVSDRKKVEGQELLKVLASLTDLPEKVIEAELDGVIKMLGCDAERLTMDDLRLILMQYLEMVDRGLPGQNATDVFLKPVSELSKPVFH